MIWLLLVALALGVLAWYLYQTKLRKFIDPEERKKYFADLMRGFAPIYKKVVDGEKRILFEQLKSIQPKVPDAKQKGLIRILEIGAGSGVNLEYYPPNCLLSIVEPNEFFKDMMMDNLKKFPGIQLENYYITRAEDMKAIEDESFDVVVATIVLCSVSNVQKVLKEVKRVLVPAGKFLYFEHVLDKPGTLLYYKQQLLTRLGIWGFLFDGCHLNRNSDKEVENGHFSQVLQKRFDIETSSFYIFPYIKVHATGVAIKES